MTSQLGSTLALLAQMASYRLFCASLDQNTGLLDTFSVKVQKTEYVEDLQNAIKDRVPDQFATVAARKLELYKVNLDEFDEKSIKGAFEAIVKGGSAHPRLYASLQLATYFENAPVVGKVHILIKVAPGESRDPRLCGRDVAEIVLSSPQSPPSSGPPQAQRARQRREKSFQVSQ